jgi:hypothetical protein
MNGGELEEKRKGDELGYGTAGDRLDDAVDNVQRPKKIIK